MKTRLLVGLALVVTGGCRDVGLWIDSALYRPEEGLEDAHRDLRDALPVFPGAEGFGTDTTAGRGGEIYVVDTLAADGPGSLRDAVSEEGRTVVFAVGGTIDIREDIALTAPHITVAGETAPSPGITIIGAGLMIATHDVFISHLAIRPGDREDGPDPEIRDAITIARDPGLPEDWDVGHIVIDHCSMSWALDETGSSSYARIHDVTWSHNIVSEPLSNSLHPEGEHSKGLMVGDGSRRISAIGNLMAHSNDRNPLFKGDTSVLFANNLTYNPGDFGLVHYGLPGCCPALATIVGNRVIPGPDTPEDRGHPVHVTGDVSPDTEVYLDDNCGGDNRIDTLEPVAEPPVTVEPLSIIPCADVRDVLLPSIGARPWDRAADDVRVVDDVINGTGGIVDTPPGWQGLLDQPRTEHELALPPDPAADEDGDGYTNLEEWLHQQRNRTAP